ncbi:MAG TPA: translocase, partial [Sphingobium sp.]|nr:translocase [Sphingobium sp.]
VGKARGMARHFRTGIDAMVREAELEELEKKWADQNRRIMEEHPPETLAGTQMEPLQAPSTTGAGQDSPPPFVAQSAPVSPAPAAPMAGSGDASPPVADTDSRKGDATA